MMAIIELLHEHVYSVPPIIVQIENPLKKGKERKERTKMFAKKKL